MGFMVLIFQNSQFESSIKLHFKLYLSYLNRLNLGIANFGF